MVRKKFQKFWSKTKFFAIQTNKVHGFVKEFWHGLKFGPDQHLQGVFKAQLSYKNVDAELQNKVRAD